MSGRYPDALQCYARAFETDPDNAKALVSKGDSLYALGRYQDAIKCL